MKPKAISLFSGAGGLDVAVEDAGFSVCASVEINRDAAASLRLNKWLASASEREFQAWFDGEGQKPFLSWSDASRARVRERLAAGVGRHTYLDAATVFDRDIRTVTSEELSAAAAVKPGELDLLFGGPPCQSFSRAGLRAALSDDRGQLFMEFVRIASDLKPRWILLENVKGLVQTKATVWSVECSACGTSSVPLFDPDAFCPQDGTNTTCESCGSQGAIYRVTQSKPGGSLDWIQSAFRRAGYQTRAFLLNAVDFGVPQRRERVFVVGSRDGEPLFQPLPTLTAARSLWDTLFSQPNPDHAWPLDPELAVLWVKNVVRPHDEPVTWNLRTPAPTIGAHQGAKLAIAPRGVPAEQLFRQQWHTLGRRQGDTPPVMVEHSYLSDRDLLLLQTFPEYWALAGTRMERAFQIGNAVPPLLGFKVVTALTNMQGTSAANNGSTRPKAVDPRQASLF